MRFDDQVREHLSGAAFNNALEVRIGDGQGIDRVSLLVELCRDKRVIDLGFADHAELVGAKAERGVWLHGALAAVAERCLGIDTSEAGVQRARDLGYRDILTADITRDAIGEIDADDWDLLILGEILEHVDDPVRFLSAIRERYGVRIGRFVLTVPNVFAVGNLLNAVRGRETVNSDHRYWFTPYTLAKVLTRAGLRPEWFTFCESFRGEPARTVHARLRSTIAGLAKGRSPALRPDLVMAATVEA